MPEMQNKAKATRMTSHGTATYRVDSTITTFLDSGSRLLWPLHNQGRSEEAN